MKKLFVAIACNKGIEDAVAPVLKKMRINADQKEMEARWAPAENFHVTLVFLGSTREELIPELEEKIKLVADQHSPFRLKITGMGAFPDDFKSRVLWFGVQNSKGLRSLQEDLAQALNSREEGEYTPHMTFARLRNPGKSKDLLSPFVRKDFGKVDVTEVILYESIIKTPYTFYKEIARIPLTASPPVEEI